jgi:dolichol-phosphate mannosyltransferase
MKMMDTRTVIIPTYNEAKNIELIVGGIKKVVPSLHILVVDDNSPDGTANIVRALNKKDPTIQLLFRQKKEGLGKAYMHAFTELKKDPAVSHIIMMDADFSHDPSHLPALIAASKHSDIVIGSRYVVGGDTEGWEVWRKFLSKYANVYCRVVTRIPVRDSTAGFNMISLPFIDAELLSKLNLSGYAFQMELKYLLWKKGARFTEVPILFRNRREGESKISNHIIAEGIIAPWKMIFKK